MAEAGTPKNDLDAPGAWPARVDLGVYVVDDGGRILAVNSRGLELLRWEEDDVLGRDQHELLHRTEDGGTLPTAQCPFMHALLSRRRVRSSRRAFFARPDGTVLPVEWTSAPCTWAGAGAGMMVVFHEAENGRSEPDRSGPDRAGLDRAGPGVPGQPSGSFSQLERLALLAETTSRLTSTLQEQECVERLVELVVPRLADWVVVDLTDEQSEVWRSALCRLHLRSTHP